MKYYGTDWTTFLCNLIAIWLIGNGTRYGFVFGMVACVADLGFGYLAESPPIMMSAVLFAIFNVRAYCKWKKLGRGNGNKK